jgi:plasmid maintenance system antidote protein VapI
MGNYKCQRPIHPGELLKEEVGNKIRNRIRNLPSDRI